MKNKICLILVFLFSLINVGAFPFNKSASKFPDIEKEILKLTQFYENGVKLEYTSSQERDKVLEEIASNLSSLYKHGKMKITENDIFLEVMQKTIKANVYSTGEKTLVEIIITNFDKENNLSKLMKELTKLQEVNASNIRYFQYVKGKLSNTEGIKREIQNTLDLKDINTLDIHNGYVGTADLYNGERVNFAVSSYDTGTYLIIGTPIIFSTY